MRSCCRTCPSATRTTTEIAMATRTSLLLRCRWPPTSSRPSQTNANRRRTINRWLLLKCSTNSPTTRTSRASNTKPWTGPYISCATSGTNRRPPQITSELPSLSWGGGEEEEEFDCIIIIMCSLSIRVPPTVLGTLWI